MHSRTPRILAIRVVAMAWRERWTGTLSVQTKHSLKQVPFKNGGPTRLSDFNVLNARALDLANFQFGPQSGRGDWASTGGLLLRLGFRHPEPLNCEWVSLDLTNADAQHLGLSESLLTLSERGGSRAALADLAAEQEDPRLLGALARLGFLVESKQEAVRAFTAAPVAGLLRGSGDLSRFFDEDSLLDGELVEEEDPELDLIQALREFSLLGSWCRAADELADYVGPMDHAELAAWRALVTVRCRRGESSERLVGAAKWSRLARRLPSSEESERILAQVEQEISELQKTQWSNPACA